MELIDTYSKYKVLYEKYANQMYSYGMAFGVEENELYDLIHDVFLHLFEHENEIREDGSEKYYLFQCLKNKIISQKRKEICVENITEANDLLFSMTVSGIEVIEEKEKQIEISRQIEDMMACLTDRQREAVYLRFMQELEYDEIAVILGLTTKGTRKLIYRAIEHIREQFGPACVCLLFSNHFF